MSMWKKAMDYLGLGPDDAYDDYEVAPEPERAPRGPRPVPEYETEPPARSSASRPSYPTRDGDITVRGPQPATDHSNVQPRPITPRQPAAARPAPSAAVSGEPYTVRPRRFDSAQEVADKFKEGQPVIMNLEAADREVSRRLIDFASGLCYGLNGTMEKVASGVYLLKPPARQAGYDHTGYGA
jgi:cell division inhibitor SepF